MMTPGRGTWRLALPYRVVFGEWYHAALCFGKLHRPPSPAGGPADELAVFPSAVGADLVVDRQVCVGDHARRQPARRQLRPPGAESAITPIYPLRPSRAALLADGRCLTATAM